MQCLQSAQDKEDEEAEKQIAARERVKWRRLNYVLGKHHTGACLKVQMEQNDGSTLEYTSQEDVQNAIRQNIHMQQFYLAEEAPICLGPLRGSFGYNSVSPTASAILDGSYIFPDNFDQATREILEECARI